METPPLSLNFNPPPFSSFPSHRRNSLQANLQKQRNTVSKKEQITAALSQPNLGFFFALPKYYHLFQIIERAIIFYFPPPLSGLQRLITSQTYTETSLSISLALLFFPPPLEKWPFSTCPMTESFWSTDNGPGLPLQNTIFFFFAPMPMLTPEHASPHPQLRPLPPTLSPSMSFFLSPICTN